MTHRIFVALPISPDLQNDILAWEQKFQNLPVRWLKGKNLHLTLVPPWEESKVNKVIEALKRLRKPPQNPLRHPPAGGKEGMGRSPIELNFIRVTFGPHPRAPRLIWAEGESVDQLSVFRDQLCQTLGFKPEPRPFKLHLTLARFRPEDFRTFPTQTLNETVDWHDTINSFVLMESHLLPSGADYEVLAKIHLTPR